MRPLRLIERLVELTLPRDADLRDAVLGDLVEEYSERVVRSGGLSALRWYVRQAGWLILLNLWRRATRAPRNARMSHERLMTDLPKLLADGLTDMSMAVRTLLRRPGFLATASLTIALGIGSAAAVFSVADATVLRALDVPDRDRLVSLRTTFEATPHLDFEVSSAELRDLSEDVQSFQKVGAWAAGRVLLEPMSGRDARTVDAAFTVGEVYALVGATVAAGRLPGSIDDTSGAAPVALISHALWHDAFGADPGIFGARTLRIGASTPLIIGALAPGARLPGYDPDVWIHTVLEPPTAGSDRSGHALTTIALLRPSATPESARAEIAALQSQWAQRYAGRHSFGLDGHAVVLEPLVARVLGRARAVALLLSLAAGLLLLLACANVANLLLASGETRSAEVGVRIALGASARRVVQPVLFEGVTVGVAGGILGLALAAAGIPLLLLMAPADLAAAVGAGISPRVIVFALTLAVATGLLFSAVPAWKAGRRAPSELLRTSGRSRTASTRGLRLLVGSQAALATVLLSGAGLLATSLHMLSRVDPGIEPASRLAMTLTLPVLRYPDAAAVIAFHDRTQQRLEALPGAQVVAAVRTLPLRDPIRQENVLREGSVAAEERVSVGVQAATAGALSALGIPLVDGRDLDDGDRAGAVRVALLNRSAADLLWPGQSAIGKRLRATFLPRTDGLITIVGVYADVRSAGLSADPAPEIMLPVAQALSMGGWTRQLTVVMRTSAAPGSMIAAARATIREIDPAVAIGQPTEMTNVLRASTARERFLAALVSAFTVMAVIIAAVGVYGVVAFTVARQTRELAIRNALGADRGVILRGVLRANTGVAAAGALAGAAIAAALAPTLGQYLHGVEPRNVAILAGAPLALVVVALISSFAPAMRATRVSLAQALQQPD